MHMVIQTFLLWLMLRISGKNSTDIKEICYPEIGCFSTESPWDGFWRPTPQSPEALQIGFYIITRNTMNKNIEDWRVTFTSRYKPTFQNLQELDYKVERKLTVVHIHGLYDGTDEIRWDPMKDMTSAYLLQQDVNVVCVEWDSHSMNRGYPQSVSNSRIVAAVTAKFIENLIEFNNLTANQIHLIGFSLGAHIAGYVGKQIPNIYRITALEAAQPGFENFDHRVRLHYTDAQYVDALHTNARSFYLTFGFGYVNPIGQVDFYFNGGAHQPGCWKNADEGKQGVTSFKSIPMALFYKVTNFISRCSHDRAFKYWIEALRNNDCTMWGIKRNIPRYQDVMNKATLGMTKGLFDHDHECKSDNCVPVGLNTFALSSRGIFYVETSPRKPFCRSLTQYGKLRNVPEVLANKIV